MVEILPKNNRVLGEFDIQNPTPPIKDETFFNPNYHHKFLKNLKQINFYHILNKILYVHVHELHNSDLKVLLKSYGKYQLYISTNHVYNSVLITIFLERGIK